MFHTLLALGLLAGSELYAENELYPDLLDYVGGGGAASGLLGLQICTMDPDDATPGVGVGYGPLGLGCNIVITNGSNVGATAITTFDGVPPTVPGTPGSILYVVGPATAANATSVADSGSFALERAWNAAGSGQETRVLILECIAADTFVEVGRHNGPRHFDDQIEVEVGDFDADFTNSQLVVGHSDTGQTSVTDRIGVVGEATADGSDESRGLAGYAVTSSAEDATGVLGIATVAATGDTTTAYGGIFASADTHASGPNVGLLCQAANSSITNYCLEVYAGSITSTLGTDLDLNSASTATATGTNDTSLLTGNATNTGDYDSGAQASGTGTTTTLGDSGAITRGTGDAADTSGDLTDSTGTSANTGGASGHMYRTTGNQTHATGSTSGGITDTTGTAAGTGQTGAIISYTGSQTNSGAVASGAYTWTTGNTTTAGVTGSMTHTTGLAGGGSGDAGSHIFQTHGANPRLTIAGDGSATFTGTVDLEDHIAVGDGSSVSASTAVVIDSDFSSSVSGEALSVTGSQIEVTAGTGDILHTQMSPGATTFNTNPTIHGYAATLNILEPNIVLADGATVTHAATVRIVSAPTEGGTSNWSLWVDDDDVKFDGALTVDGLTTLGGGLALGGDLDFAGNDAKNLDDLWADPVATDAAPRVTVLGTQPVFVEPGATNIDGANMVLAPSPGAQTLEGVTLAATTGDVLGFDVYSNGVLTHTDKTEGVDWDCDGAGTDIICVCNLWDDFLANPIVGVVVTRTDVTCSDEKLTFSIDPGVSEYLTVTTSDDVNLDMAAGVDGVVQMAQGVRLTLDKDLDTYISALYDDVIYAYASGAPQIAISASYLNLTDNYLTGTAGTRINFPAAEQTRFCNTAESQCFVLAATAADTATLFDGVGTGAGTFEMQTGGTLQFGTTSHQISYYTGGILFDVGDALTIRQVADKDDDGGAMLTLNSSGSAEMTADGNGEVQYGLHVTPELAMTLASAFVGWEHDPEITSQGTAQNYHYRLDWSDDGVYEQKVQDDGDIILHEDPGSDTDPLDGRIFGANAWAQASAGAARNGADAHIAAGIRSMRIVCDNFAWANLDEVQFTIEGVAQAALIEGTQWNVGIDDDATCVDLGAAITTAAYGITVDCTTTPATCYLTPDEDLISVDDITITDGGVDGDFGQVVEGVDGSVILHGIHNALIVNNDGSGNTLLQLGGTTGAFPALKRDGVTIEIRKADDSGRGSLAASGLSAASNIIGSAHIRAGAASKFYHNGLTAWTSSGDGVWEMGNNAGTQGVRFDTATTADWLSLNDESGNDLTLAVGALVLSNGGTRSIYTSIVGANLQIGTSSGSSPFSTGAYTTYTGNQTHAGDYNSGTLTYCSTGTTNTDGNTGDCISQTGASGDGTGADAGNHIWNINGANEAMRIAGATGSATFAYESHFANNAAAATFGDVTTDADVVLAFDAVTNQGSLKYMEDEDEFDFGSSNISLAVNNNIGWSGYFLIEADSAADQVIFKVDSGVGNQIVITPGDESDDHGHAAAGGGNAVLYIHGDDIDDDATAWISATHDLTDGVVETGKGDLKLISAGGDAYIGTAAQGVKFDAATTDDILNLGTEAAATIGLRNVAGWWDLQADGDLILDNPGGTVNSPSLRLLGDDGGVEVEGGIYLTQGLDPYIRISVDNASDAGPPVLTGVLDIHDQVVAFVNDNATDIGAAGANRPKDLFLAGNAVVGGSTTGTSFIIGGNTLDTTEWGFLDGQDQDVSSDATGVAFGTASVTTTLTVPTGTDLPATCSQGEIFMDTNDDSCADDNAGTGTFCGCAATNVWEAFQ